MSSAATKRNKLLIILLAGITVAAVFFVFSETFGWLSFFRQGQGQKFEAGYIAATFTDSYAEYPGKTQAQTKSGYTYTPGDDLCEPPRDGDPREFRYLGFNLTLNYRIQSACVIRFKVEYRNTYSDPETGESVTAPFAPAYEAFDGTEEGFDAGRYTYTAYSGDALAAKGRSMILASFAGSAFVCGGFEGDATYWYYGARTAGVITDTVLSAAPDGAYINGGNGILARLELAGDNIYIDTGRITIRITAQIRQYEAGVITWGNYKEAHFDL